MTKIRHTFEVVVDCYDKEVTEIDIEDAVGSLSGLEKVSVRSNGEEEI